MRRVAALLVLLGSVDVLTQQPLKIVVLEGEGTVNIIQQKTAVRALVEVRDQNNLPVAGATVTFAITGKGGATVAGTQSLTVTTNAAGQAALGGISPATTGGLQISVNASFNGLTATTSITQSVVTSAAATVGAGSAGGAATASGGAAGAAGAAGGAAGAAGGAAAGGGAAGAAAGAAGAAGATASGLSTAAIAGIVGGAAAAVGGGVAATGGGDDGGSSGGGSGGSSGVDPTGGSGPAAPGLLPSCEFRVSPEDILVGNEGGTVGLTIVMTSAEPCYDPTWRVDLGSAASWISISPTSGTRTGTAVLSIAPYAPTATAPNRVVTIIVGYERVLISQPCRCPAAALAPSVSRRSAPRRAAGSAARDDR